MISKKTKVNEKKSCEGHNTGTILEESFFDDNPSNFLCSWNEVNGSHSISWVDLSTEYFVFKK